MGSLRVEQGCVVKFLTLERTSTSNIYRRLKKVYQKNVLPLEKVIKLHQKFANWSLPITAPSSFSEYTSIKQEPEDEIPELEVQINSVLEMESMTSAQHVPQKRKRPHPPTAPKEINRTGRSKRKASMKAAATWQEAFNCKNIKEEISDYIDEDTFEQTENISMVEEQEYEEHDHEPDHIEENDDDDDNEYVKGFPISSVQLPFLPQTDKITPQEILEAVHGNSLRCLLCENKNFKDRIRIRRHFTSVHANHFVRLEDQLSLLCKKLCKGITTGHYHCPFCNHVTNREKRLFLHYHRHFIRRRVPIEQQIRLSQVRTNDCLCIDPAEGLFLVSRSLYVSDQPVHVIVNDSKYECSDPLCEQSMELARSNGNEILCKHLARAGKPDVPIAPDTCIASSLLNSFSLTAEEREHCESLLTMAAHKGVSPITPWVDDEQSHYYSIYCDAPFATFGRTLVKRNISKDAYECVCPFPKDHFCPFKILARIQAFQ